MVLVAGGGEGLPNMMQLMAQFALQKFPIRLSLFAVEIKVPIHF